MARWLEFTADFTFRPASLQGRTVIKHRKGSFAFVNSECEAQALAAKAAKPAQPRRGLRDDSAAARRDLGLPE